jgi:CRISPR-associated endonuclease/helicase Cas3
VVFAKSTPIGNPETLFMHTLQVRREAELLEKSYGQKILESVPRSYRQYFWDALLLACSAHDLGKVQSLFQNKILRACKRQNELLPQPKNIKEIPHNIISPAFIHNQLRNFPKEIIPAIYQAIAFHHGRGKEFLDSDERWIDVTNVIKNDICNRLHELEDIKRFFRFELLAPNANYMRKLQEPVEDDIATFYLLLKGLLHRADHSGSAHLPSEVYPNKYSSNQVIDYLINRGIERSRIWQLQYDSTVLDQNVVLQAGTGSGKTEFALCWMGNRKGFYTLPMRTSVNAMFDRLKMTYCSEEIGLLHSDSAFYVLSDQVRGTNRDDGITDTLRRIDISKQLSMPISVTTADQIFTAAFRYEGYEKVFATLSYSGLIIDEIQSYDPDIVAVILNTLVNVAKIGCKFCIITATLPKMYLQYLKSRISNIEFLPERFVDVPRHRIKLLSKPIDDSQTIDQIIDLSKKHSSVLVIANTVKMAKRIKSLLQERKINASLIHSLFIYEDRSYKENELTVHKSGCDIEKGIWITTQIAEVSLDIDFDVMVTEISSIDSQVQRWGRVWRSRRQEYTSLEPNIYVAPCPSDDGHIYDKNLVELTEEKLSKPSKSSDTELSDLKEFRLVQDVFDSKMLNESKYKRKFDISIEMLERNDFSVETKREAQHLFRRISNVNVIPSEVYDKNQEAIDSAISNLDNHDRFSRLTSLYEIRKKSVSIPYHYFKDIQYRLLSEDYEIICASMKYSFDMGVELAPVSSAAII